jgi:hypothetical protein
MCWFGKCEFVLGHDQNIINAYNKMHVGYKIKVKWKIGGFNRNTMKNHVLCNLSYVIKNL